MELKEIIRCLQNMRETSVIAPIPFRGEGDCQQLIEEINTLIMEEERKAKMVHQLISSGMWTMHFNHQGEITKVVWSQEFRFMLGYENRMDFPDRLDSWTELLHPEDRESTLEAYWHAVKCGGKYDVIYRLKTRYQGYRWFHAIGETLRWEKGNPRLFTGVFIDITREKEQKENIQARLEMQEQLNEMSHELEMNNEILNALCEDYNSIYIVNLDTGKYDIYRMTDTLPKTVSEISFTNQIYDVAISQYIERWVSENDAGFVRYMTERKRLKRLVRETGRVSFRYCIKERADRQRHFEFCFCDISKTLDETVVVMGARNIDALMDEKEDSRRETLEQVQETLAGSQTGLWSLLWEEGKAPVMHGDRTLHKLMGIPEEELSFNCFRDWVSGIDEKYRGEVMEVLKRSIANGFQEIVYPCSYGKKEQMYFRLGVSSKKNFPGSGYRLSGYWQDVTDTVKDKQDREELLKEALQEAQQANKVKTEFLSHMSHDIRTPINGILGLLTIAENEEEDISRQKECRRKIRQSAEHLLSLVNDVLDLSRLESGKQTRVEETFDIHEVLDHCMSILLPQAQLQQIKIQDRREEIGYARLRGCPLQLRQILINIIGNAIKYNKECGSVQILTKETQGCENTVWLEFEIKDTGIGMKEEFQKHIFEAFTQETQGARTSYAGTGLGMAITKKLVDQMGGTIHLSSQIGEGSCFFVRLPFEINRQENKESVEEGQSFDVAGMHVLLAEDNELNREIAQYVLEEGKVEVTCAANGAEALEIFEKSEPGEMDCIIMDVMMPVMDGLQAAKEIRKLSREDAKTIPMIALSANAFEEDRKKTREAGMNQHVSKTLDANQLFAILTQYKKQK